MKASSKNKDGQSFGLGFLGRKLYVLGKGYWAGWMEEKASGLSRKQLYVILTVFMALIGSHCIFLIYRGLAGQSGHWIKAERIKPVRTASTAAVPGNRHAGGEELKIKAFRNYMDGLESTARGRKTRDSIIQARPGLLDSIAAAEAYLNRN